MNGNEQVDIDAAPADHPSEHRLDAYYLGELAEQDAATVAQHVRVCDHCRARMKLRRRGFAAFAEVDAEALLSRVIANSKQRESDTCVHRRGWLGMRRWRYPALATGMAAAAALVFAVWSSSGPQERRESDTTRSKGRLTLRVFHKQGVTAVERQSGDVFRAGDRIRFQVHLPAGMERAPILVVGVEDSGKRSVYFPVDGSPIATPPVLSADGALAGAVELDDYTGIERLYVVACNRAFDLTMLHFAGPGNAVRVPDGCQWHDFALVKQ